MFKIGIVTMISNNYGNRLQNYALQTFLQNQGYNVETFHNPFNLKYNEHIYHIKKIIRKILFRCYAIKFAELKKEDAFSSFNKKYIIWSYYWLNKKKHLSKISDEYDYIICGSDQVWNPESLNINGRFFGNFMPDTSRLSYAASFGLERIMEGRRSEWSKYLMGMKAISVREDKGVEIVYELTGRTAEQNIDPTMLLSKEEWRNIECKPKRIDTSSPYLLSYFLGTRSNEYYNAVSICAKSKKLNIIELNNPKNIATYRCSPAEFIYLIKNAAVVLTDSFHGIVFSILFHVPFIAFQRQGLKYSMESRIESLLTMFGLDECRYEEIRKRRWEISSVDYDKIDTILSEERKKSLDFFLRYLK